MNLSFQEKSLWLMFVSLLVTFGLYFAVVVAPVLPVDPSSNVLPPQIALFVVAVVVLVIAQVVGHVVIAIVDQRTDTDERDRLIALKGTRNAAYVLATGVFCALCAALVTRGNFVFTHLLLAFWVLAQLVETGSQLALYRRGS